MTSEHFPNKYNNSVQHYDVHHLEQVVCIILKLNPHANEIKQQIIQGCSSSSLRKYALKTKEDFIHTFVSYNAASFIKMQGMREQA